MGQLRGGYTTGACAAAASKAAALLLHTGEALRKVQISMPDGTKVEFPLIYARNVECGAEAAVRKDAGSDPDVTHGATVVSRVAWLNTREIRLVAGEGVGTVTKPGLSRPPGYPAINPAPQKMIEEAVRDVTDRGMEIVISIPGGKELAGKTFNPRLGIIGGLSILGTTGRVRPFSSSALKTSLKCSLDVAAACGVEAPVLVPGHIGERAARRHFHLTAEQVIEVSNEWGYMLDCAAAHPFRGLLVLGHPGKLGKLAAGEWDTHSSRSKSAVPWISQLAGDFGIVSGNPPTVEGIFGALTEAESKKLGDALAAKVCRAVAKRLPGRFALAAVLVNMKGDRLGSAGELAFWRKKNPL